MQKRWIIKSQGDANQMKTLSDALKVDDVIATLLLQKNIKTFEEAASFFRPSLDKLHDPFEMKGMENAVSRINKALANDEKILLFGDYDVDGTTAVALLYTHLKHYHPHIDYYIPNRYDEGYGVSFKGIDAAYNQGVSLIISLDCGIRSVEEIAYAASKGIDFIVCDHHTPGNELPECIVLDPKQEGCHYPFKELSGCGVGFKLLQGCCIVNDWDLQKLFAKLDLVAVSIGADIVSVSDENRILAYHGIRQLNEHPRVAFSRLIELAQKTFPITLTDVVFAIAPRINAAGRLRSGKYAVELMTTENEDELTRIAQEIEADNQERRKLDQQITLEAFEMIENDSTFHTRKSTVVFNPNWHKGVVGIVASRLIEKYHRPTIVLTESHGKVTGSARSVNNFDIHAALVQCEHLLEQFGGHTHAAGMTLLPEKVNDFQHYFDAIVQQSIQIEDETPEQIIDLEITFDLFFTVQEDRLKIPRLKRILDQFEPHGPDNMKPVFLAKNVYSSAVRVLKESHLKLSLVQPNCDLVLEGIGFNLATKLDEVASGVPFDVVFTLETNKWKNRETLQLNIKDIRASL
jgi:single-stranded-DNA-specific exonuclease